MPTSKLPHNLVHNSFFFRQQKPGTHNMLNLHCDSTKDELQSKKQQFFLNFVNICNGINEAAINNLKLKLKTVK